MERRRLVYRSCFHAQVDDQRTLAQCLERLFLQAPVHTLPAAPAALLGLRVMAARMEDATTLKTANACVSAAADRGLRDEQWDGVVKQCLAVLPCAIEKQWMLAFVLSPGGQRRLQRSSSHRDGAQSETR